MPRLQKLPISFTKQKRPSHGPKRWDISKAKLLAKAVQARHNLTKGFTIGKWAKSFYLMRTSNGFCRARISKVLLWYISNMKKKYIPEAFSAASFRRKFIRIESAMEKQQESHAQIPNLFTALEERSIVSERSVAISERLRIHYWPKGSCNDILETVDSSLKNFHVFNTKFKRLYRKLETRDIDLTRVECGQLLRFCEFLEGTIPSSEFFVEQWMMAANRQIQNWDDWEGELYRMRFQIKSKRFMRFGYTWAVDFCGVADRWTLFLDELMEC